MNLLVVILTAIFTGIIGYFAGACKAFREAKQKAYQEILPPIVKMAYRSKQADEGDFCEALSKLWLYGSKTITKKMDDALYIVHDPTKGNISTALQKVIAEMRKDIQIVPWQTLKPDDVGHIFTRIHRANNKKKNSEREG